MADGMTTDPCELHTLRARYVFTATGEPIADGAVTIQGQRIVAVGKAPAGGHLEDLGNVAILPGPINAHTHLEFSDVPAPLGRQGMGFVDWIAEVVAFRMASGKSCRRPVELGLQECTRFGTTGLGEIAQPDWSLAAFEQAPLDTTIFYELIGPTAWRVSLAMDLAQQHIECSCKNNRVTLGLSPHAPYSVHAKLLREVVAMSASSRVPLAFHLAESAEEIELLQSGSGPMRQLLDVLGAWEPGALQPGTRPLHFLRTLQDAHRTLVIHGNYLDDEEIAFLGQRAARMAVVYCPRTHAWFGHKRYPLEKMLSAGVAVSLGTDSRASSPDLSMLAEMRAVAATYPAIPPSVVLQLGTLRAAAALGWQHEVGSLQPGKYANLAVVALPQRDAADPHELLFDSDGPVVKTYYRGKTSADSVPA
jgi:cytosine/adenosine deaminase-related metal-dependent hydrolase